MFPINDNDWIIYIETALVNNVNPCWVDIVGDAQNAAAFYYLDPPAPDTNPTSVAFRMRLNGNPLKNDPDVYELREFVWGTQIRDPQNGAIFTVLVNAGGENYALQVRDSAWTLIYNVPIVLNSPIQPGDNVRVVDAGANFPCENPMLPDEDYFLDFTLPTTAFPSFNFTSSTYRMCYFTSTQDEEINKDNVCGMILNPPIGVPFLCVTKRINSGTKSVCTDEVNSWVLLITIYNCGTVPVDDILMTDTLNSEFDFDSPPVFVPNVNVSYNSGTRQVTWTVGTLAPGEVTAISITMTGSFAAPGHYILNSGTVTATSLTPIFFDDTGILVYAQDQLTAVKEIVSGPLTIEKCAISTWTLRITVTNTEAVDIPNLVVRDLLSGCFTLESEPVLLPSTGYASFSAGEIIWTIDVLAGDSSGTLLITVQGFFTCTGQVVLDRGSVLNACMQTVTFQDPGVEVLPAPIGETVPVYGSIRDCRTNRLLGGVLATVYDKNCGVIGTYCFDWYYCLDLPEGTYSVLFTKAGYDDKFLALMLYSDMDIAADVNMAPKALPWARTVYECSDTMDLFSYIVCEKIDADVIYSGFVCINSCAEVESMNDIVDGASCTILCNSKLRLVLDLEKNLVYKLEGVKDFKYYEKTLPVCFPLRCCKKCDKVKCSTKVFCVDHCKDENIVYNMARLRFKAYLLREDDVMVKGAE